MGFQSQVKSLQGIGVEGDFASANPRYSAIAGPGGFVAGAAGVRIGYFCWGAPPIDLDGTDQIINSFGTGQPMGFVHREQQALITAFLAGSTMVIPQGFMVTVFSDGEFIVVNNGAGEATPGMKAYADYATGKISFAAAGAPGTAVATGSIAAATSSFTGVIADDVLTVTGAVTGTIYPGTTLSGTGVASGTQIVSQTSGTAGGDGTYLVSIPEQTVASTTISGTYGVFTAASGLTGLFGVGDTLTGSSVVAGTTITQQLTGPTGGLGTYVVNNNTVVSSTSITGGTSIETKWYAVSSGLAGDLVKMSPIKQGF
jgi:hypothetical protein